MGIFLYILLLVYNLVSLWLNNILCKVCIFWNLFTYFMTQYTVCLCKHYTDTWKCTFFVCCSKISIKSNRLVFKPSITLIFFSSVSITYSEELLKYLTMVLDLSISPFSFVRFCWSNIINYISRFDCSLRHVVTLL